MLPDSLQLSSKLFVDDQIDEEVGQVVDVELIDEVAADFLFRIDCVEGWPKRQDEDEEQTKPDLH